jgi:hypothetical protein
MFFYTSPATNQPTMTTKLIKTVSDHREEKARMSGDHEAYVKAQRQARYDKARQEYLRANPEVGTIIRNGKEIFYRNLEPYYLGRIEEFTPASVIKF